jgi:hypothetical protein
METFRLEADEKIDLWNFWVSPNVSQQRERSL